MPRGNPASVALGPGALYFAILGSPEPTDLTTAWTSAWLPLGYTDAGVAHSVETSYDDVEVAEELEPVDSAATGRTVTVSFDAAEQTALNYKRALNGGTITVTGTAPNQIFKFEPPDLGNETRTMIGWESERNLASPGRGERWVWRLCKQTGGSETERRKGATKALIPMSFRCYKPADAKSFMRLSGVAGEAIG